MDENCVILYYQDQRLLICMICLLKIFLNSIDGFGLIWKEKQYFKIFEEGMRRVERQYSLMQLFFVLCHVA